MKSIAPIINVNKDPLRTMGHGDASTKWNGWYFLIMYFKYNFH